MLDQYLLSELEWDSQLRRTHHSLTQFCYQEKEKQLISILSSRRLDSPPGGDGGWGTGAGGRAGRGGGGCSGCLWLCSSLGTLLAEMLSGLASERPIIPVYSLAISAASHSRLLLHWDPALTFDLNSTDVRGRCPQT